MPMRIPLPQSTVVKACMSDVLEFQNVPTWQLDPIKKLGYFWSELLSKLKTEPSLIPEGQREVTVFNLV